ncbi:MAG: alpha/beta hydrolase [Acidimicrobiales bacterium]|nr:alpha/beta hydrolase [Acidimicrobiales bacterium]
MAGTTVEEHWIRTDRHRTFYLAAGPEDGPLLIFVHGWPELSISWRHQLPVFAGLGFRAVAPDLRGYGRSSVYPRHEDYAQEHVVADMIDLLDGLGADRAVWVGHDWGSPVVWNIAAHHPDRCHAVANLCVPYATLDKGWEHTVALVDRSVYPTDQYPVGQWDYQLFYEESFERASAVFDADAYLTAKALFRKGNPKGLGKPSATAAVRAAGGWFGGADRAPDLPADRDVVTEEDLRCYAEALSRNSFFGPDSYYMNHPANEAYAATAADGGRLSMPVLFLHARYDYTCETINSRLAEPMRELCGDLTEAVLDTGHWMAQERPAEVNAELARWLATKVPSVWPVAASR